jgi:selenocysteine-specific elongation factor
MPGPRSSASAPQARAQRAAGERSALTLGTAGHIDHGKTTLVRALTGVDTDRLPEEKARGITLVLGFAELDLGDGLRLSVVDVPGHERLVRTMVSGATGIDLVLLVVAADEGVMPQTREHVAICDLLGIARGVVALTKVDATPDDVMALARDDVSAHLAGTALAGSEIVPVSAVTGAGLPALRDALRRAATGAAARTPRAGPPRLPVDRVFAMRGFGTVVTGTLVGAGFATGDAVEISPSGRRARVRGVQSHGSALERAEPGRRTALNLQGVEVADVARGEVVTVPGALAPARAFDARVRWLPAAPPLRDEIAVELLLGTSERRARIGPLGPGPLAPGDAGFARVHIEEGAEPLPCLPGDRFVVRGFARLASGGATLGGGVVLDVAPARRRRGDPRLLAALETFAAGDEAAALRARIARRGLAGIARAALRTECAQGEGALGTALGALAAEGAVAETSAGVLLGREALDDVCARALRAIEALHAAEPLRAGHPRGALRGRLPANLAEGALELALGRLAAAGQVALDGDLVRGASHASTLGAGDRALAERIVAEARARRLEPPSPRDWSALLGAPEARLRALLQHLERTGDLVRAPGPLWFDRAAVDALRERVAAHLRAHGALTTPDYKALIGTPRRTAVPLMELFDAEKLTLRVGEKRVLRGR